MSTGNEEKAKMRKTQKTFTTTKEKSSEEAMRI
jgi:hypothetical protein